MSQILELAKKKSEQADILELETTRTLVGFENNKLKTVDHNTNRGVALRLFVNGKIGEGFCTNLRKANEFVDKVVKLSEFGEKAEFDLPEPAQTEELELVTKSFEEQNAEQMVEDGKKIVSTLLDYEKEILAFTTFCKDVEKIRMANSKGVDVEYVRGIPSFGVYVQLIEGENIISLAKHYKGLDPCPDPENFANELVEDLKVARKPALVKTGKMRVIFSPPSLGDVFAAFEGGINGANVVKKMGPLVDRIGEKVLNKKVTIVDDTLHPKGTLSGPIDDEGIPGRKTVLVENGVFKNYITDLDCAAELGIEPSGNGLRAKPWEKNKSYTASVRPDITNIILEKGEMSYEEMLEQTELGIEVVHMTGILLGNLINGDFSGNLEVGYKIENGKRVGKVKNTMLAGNFYNVFGEKLIALGDKPIWTGNFGGESGSFLLPHAYIRDVDISS